MPGIDRATIIQGPCLITYASSTFWSKGDVTVKPVFEKFDIDTSAWGKVDTRLKNKRYEISFEPDGRVTAALIAILWPHGDSAVGTSIFGTTDRALVVHGRDGTKITFNNSALTEMPAIRMGVGVTFAGPCKFTALIENEGISSSSEHYFSINSSAYPAETGWLASDIITQPALCTWGSAPWAAFQVDSPGWEIQPTMRLQPIGTDGFGTVDMTLQGLEVTARAIPVGPTAAQILTAMNAAGELGSSVASAGTELTVTSGTTPKAITVVVYNAALVDSALVWSASKKRVAQCTWQATRTVSGGGDPDPLFTVAIA